MRYAARAREFAPSAKSAQAKASSRGSRARHVDVFHQNAPGSNDHAGARRDWSLANVTIGSGPSQISERSRSRVLPSFPYEARIEQSLGIPIPGRSIVDPEGCDRAFVPAFTRDRVVHFATDRPSLRVAAHEAAHLAQHAGRTHEAGLGPEGHASAVERRIADGVTARGLIGPAGVSVQPAVRHYTDVSVASQSATEWDAKMALRLADNGRMAVGQDSKKHSFWAESSLISASNTTLSNRKSVIRLTELSDKISGTVPGTTDKRNLSKVSPENVANKTKGETMNIWADCGKSGRDVMGAGEGTGKNYDKMTADYKALQKPPFWLPMLGVWPLLSGTPQIVEQQTSASSPKAMKEEIFNQKLGGTGDQGLKKYQALSAADKEKFDKETGINRFATPETGQGYTMSSGGAGVPGHSTWNFHWAGVVMHSGDDRVTLENYSISDPAAQNSDWEFQMYGSAAKSGQTFHEQHKATGEHGDAPTTMKVEKR